jgi:hypothetical protein
MRFSVLNLLLLGTALAAPIHDVAQASKRDEESLVARGLVPLLERSPAFVAPKPVPKPVKPGVPGAPTAPKPPLSPDAPAEPGAPAPLKPDDPATAPKDTPDEPPRLGQDDPATAPKDTPDEPPRLGQEPPATSPADEPKVPVTNPADDTKPPANNPDDANTPVRTDDPDGPVNLPEACGLKKRCAQAPAFADAPAQWKVTTKDGKTIDYYQKGYSTQTKLGDVVTGKVKTDPPKFAGDLQQSGRYDVNIVKDQKAPNEPYLQQDRFDGAFAQDQAFTETQIKNNAEQIKEAQAWKESDKFKEQLKAKGATPDEIEMSVMFDQDYNDMIMARTLENPAKGSVVVKASFNNERDLHREYKGVTGDKDIQYTRPAFGDKADEVGWSDQLMANYRKAKENFEKDPKNNGKKAEPLKYVAQDTITPQTDTRQVIDGVYAAMNKKAGEMVTVRRTGGDAAETASFNALAGTVHGQRPIQIELGNPTADFIHVMKSADGTRYDMVVEFGRAAAAAPTI